MPVAGSGVMLGVMKVPKGVTRARPPASGAPPPLLSVWQPSQPAAWKT